MQSFKIWTFSKLRDIRYWINPKFTGRKFIVGFPKCIFTKFFFSVCYENKQPVLVTYRNIKRSKKWSDCKKECDQDGDCQYFRWKVMKEISCLVLSLDNFSLQNNRKWKKRVCYLMHVNFKPKNNYISGERFCG